MSARRWTRAFAPVGALDLRRDAQELRRLGARSRPPWRVASTAAGVRAARLHLLPSGALGHLRAVVDVGANVGEWSSALLRVAHPDRLLLIEPNPVLSEGLRGRFEDPRVTVLQAAASDVSGVAALHLTDQTHGSSLLLPRVEMDDLYGSGYTIRDAVQVPTARLDEVLEAWHEISLMKIDAQGAELTVLQGATGVLSRTTWILVEVAFQSHYEGDVPFAQLDEWMRSHGFSLSMLADPFVVEERLMWTDALYARP